MKKILVATILGLAVVSGMAQGRVLLDTATTPGPGPYPYITYGAGAGGTLGASIPASANFTVGLYFAAAGESFNDPSGYGIPGSPWVLGTGPGSTAVMSTFDGLFFGSGDFTLPNASASVSLVIVAYNGADYASSLVRGHSIAFNIAPNTTVSGGGTPTWIPGGQGFAVVAVPEPSTFALAGLGLASLLIFRRRK